MLCCLLELGIDGIMLPSTDRIDRKRTPYVKHAPIGENDKQEIFSRTAARMLGLTPT